MYQPLDQNSSIIEKYETSGTVFFTERSDITIIIPSPVQLSGPNTGHQVKSIVNTTMRYFLGQHFDG